MKTFYLWLGRMGYQKKSVFSYWFQKCSYDLSKKCTQKKFCSKNRFFLDLGKFSLGKIVFWLKLFLGALFTKVIFTFLKSVRKDGFFDDLFKEKKFSSLRRDNELFLELKKVKNGRNRSKFRKTVFYKQILDFHCPSKILCYTSNLWNFVKITGP